MGRAARLLYGRGSDCRGYDSAPLGSAIAYGVLPTISVPFVTRQAGAEKRRKEGSAADERR